MKDDQRRDLEGSYMKDRLMAKSIAALLGYEDEVSIQAVRNRMAKVNMVFDKVYGPMIEELLPKDDLAAVKARIYLKIKDAPVAIHTIMELRIELKETLSVIGMVSKLSLPRQTD